MRRVLGATLLVLSWGRLAHAQDGPIDAGASVPGNAVDAVEASVPTGESEAALTEEDLATLGIDQHAPAVNTDLKLSGFADFTFSALLISESNPWRVAGVAPNHPTFGVGNFNVYLSKFMYEWLQMLGEVRFTYLPNGSSNLGTQAVQSTDTADYADYGRTTRWGGIIIERLVLDFIVDSLLTIRLGQFLTPYGVWNVDHGSPTYIPARRPWVIGVGWIPQRQSGIELFGSVDVSTYAQLGYHLTLSNGTGPISEYSDLDDNKAVGARVVLNYMRLGNLQVGASAYYGRDSNARQEVAAGQTIGVREKVLSQYDNLTFAADLVWSYRNFHFQTEWLVHQRAYTDKGRVSGSSGLQTGFPSDFFGWGGYLLTGYRFAWLGVMPYFVFERDRADLLLSFIDLYTLQGGLNVRPVDNLVFKLSLEHVVMLKGVIANHALNLLQLQVAWAF